MSKSSEAFWTRRICIRAIILIDSKEVEKEEKNIEYNSFTNAIHLNNVLHNIMYHKLYS